MLGVSVACLEYVTAIIFYINERVKTQRFLGCLLCDTFSLEYHYNTHVSVAGYCPTLSRSTSTAREQSAANVVFLHEYSFVTIGIIMQWKTPRVRATSLFNIFKKSVAAQMYEFSYTENPPNCVGGIRELIYCM